MFGYELLAAAGILSFLGGFLGLIVCAPLSMAYGAVCARIDRYFEQRAAKRGYRLR